MPARSNIGPIRSTVHGMLARPMRRSIMTHGQFESCKTYSNAEPVKSLQHAMLLRLRTGTQTGTPAGTSTVGPAGLYALALTPSVNSRFDSYPPCSPTRFTQHAQLTPFPTSRSLSAFPIHRECSDSTPPHPSVTVWQTQLDSPPALTP